MLCLRRSRTTHQDRHVVCKTHCFFVLSQTLLRCRCQDTHVKTYVVASFPAAPLLTDIRRSTVGPGTLEDFVVTVYSVVMEYIAPALALFKLLYNRSTCTGGKVLFCLQWPQNLRQWWCHRASSCCDCITCAKTGVVHQRWYPRPWHRGARVSAWGSIRGVGAIELVSFGWWHHVGRC